MAEGEERPSGVGDDEDGEYPIGFRFKPTTEELVEFYLLPRLLYDEPSLLLHQFAIEADAYECDPEILTERYKDSGVDDTWHFLSPRYRKYRGGDRPVRRTADDRGRWKASTGKSKEEDASPKAKKAFAFTENTLAYFVGSNKDDETKTKWLMHELVVLETPDNGFHSKSDAEPGDSMLLDRYVVCTIYKSPLKKWKEIDEEAEEVPTSSQFSSSGPAPECVGEAAARAPSSSQPPAKRPAVERPVMRGQTGAPNKGISQTTLFPGGGRSVPATCGNGGGTSVRMPAGVGVGAGAGAAGHHGPPGLPALVHWPPGYNNMQGPVQVRQPPLVYGYDNRAARTANANGQAAPGQGPLAVYNNMHGSVQVQQPPLVYGYGPYGNGTAGTPNANGQEAPGQGPPPVLMRRPTHSAAATAPNSLGPKMMMRPPNLAAGQPARLPSPQQQQQQQQPPPETDEAYRNRVYARMVAEIKLERARQDSAARAGQQRIEQSASAQPACSHDEGGNRPTAGVEVMVPPAQFPVPYPYSSSSSNLAQRLQRQQSCSVTPAAAMETPASENEPSTQSVPPGPDEGSGKGDAATVANNMILQILAPNWTL